MNRMTKLRMWMGGLLLGLLLPILSPAQILDYQNKVTVILEDGTPVTLYGKAQTRSNAFTSDYYYLPTGLRLSARPDGTPEFLFMKYTTEERADQGGVQGAIIHFLMEWGLTPAQEQELQEKLKVKVKNMATTNRRFLAIEPKEVRVLGPVDVYVDDKEPSFRIISATLSDNQSSSLVTSGKAPVLPGYKAAVAGKLDKNSAQLLAATFEKARSITDISLELNYKYNLLFPAVDGKIVIDWSKVYEYVDSLIVNRNDVTWDTKDGREGWVSHQQVQGVYESLVEKKFINIAIDKTTTEDEVADKVVEEFMNVFIEAVADRNTETMPPMDPKEAQEVDEDYVQDVSYYLDKRKFETRKQQGIQVFHLKYRAAVPRSVAVVGNLASWYNGVRDNKKCVSSVNLNDPFFQHRDINLILDLEAEEMFGDEVNYVTVNVRKKRSAGNDFSDQVTIDREYLKAKGVKATVTYARGEDKNPDNYEYKVQWSLRGGRLYPENPDYMQGDWEGVTLAPPVKPRTIEFEADLDELTDLGITRATLQVRYQKFGQEIETNIPMTVSRGEPLVEKMIFTDRETRGYVYRLILTHKEEGKLALPWDSKINDDYVYATIPEELRDKNSDFFQKALEVGKAITAPSTEGTVPTKDKILDKFRNVLEIIDK